VKTTTPRGVLASKRLDGVGVHHKRLNAGEPPEELPYSVRRLALYAEARPHGDDVEPLCQRGHLIHVSQR